MISANNGSFRNNFLASALLILAVLSAVWITFQSLRGITLTGSFFTASGVTALCLLWLTLTGGLILGQPWSLFPLSLLGKVYFLLIGFLFLLRGYTILDVDWLFSLTAVGFTAIMNYLNPLRSHVGLPPVTSGFVAGRLAVVFLFLATCITLYSVYMRNLFPEYAYRVRCVKFESSLLPSGAADGPNWAWSERWRVAVPEHLNPSNSSNRNIDLGIWSNSRGEKLILTERIWTEKIQEYAVLGFNDSYQLEKAVWNAGLSRPFLMPIKLTMADEGTRVYHHERERVKAIIVVKKVQTGSGPTWVVSANIYPGSTAYNIESSSSLLERAFGPIKETLARLEN